MRRSHDALKGNTYMECPNCGELIYFDEEIILDGKADCPACGEILEFEVDECDCDCCADDE